MKLLKRFVAVLLLCSMLLLLCSCTRLDELKEQHVRYSENSKDELIYLNQTFKLIDLRGYDIWGDYAEEISGVLTENDVPLLLSQMSDIFYRRGWCHINGSKSIIMISGEVNEDDARYFLREDVFDQYQAIGFEKFFEGYSVRNHLNFEPENVKVPDEFAAAIREICTGEPVKGEEVENHAYIGTLNLCDESGEILLHSHGVYHTHGGEFFLRALDESVFEVPAKYVFIFDELFK